MRYGGAARVSLVTEGDSFVVTVNDNGPGIPDDRLEEVFEPFVRLEASRSNATGGAGLGLTLARSIAREHGGDVVLENRWAGKQVAGLRASLRLPCEQRRQKPPALLPRRRWPPNVVTCGSAPFRSARPRVRSSCTACAPAVA